MMANNINRLSVRDAVNNPAIIKDQVKRKITTKSTTEISETTEAQASRLKREEGVHFVNLFIWGSSNVLFMIFVLLVVVICAIMMFNPSTSIDDKKWVTTILFSIVSAAAGFLTGTKIPSASDK